MKKIHCREPNLNLMNLSLTLKKKTEVKSSFKKFFLKSPLLSYISFLGHQAGLAKKQLDRS